MKDKAFLKNIILLLGLALIVAGNVFVQKFANLDEMWIYNWGRCIVDGLLPYKDFNIIITPLFPYICALFLKVFGNEMIVLRFAEVIETALILFLIYKILERLKVNKNIALLFTLGLYFIFSEVFCFDYNWTVLLITLAVIYIELKQKNNFEFNFKRELLLGILVRNNYSFKTDFRLSSISSIYRI